jgi:hypothetical protein
MSAPSIKEILEDLVNVLIEKEEFPTYMKKAFSIPKDVPLAKWSLRNRFICFMNDSFDCRGRNQWETVGRHVKPGFQRAIFILGPMIIKKKGIDNSSDKEVLAGWKRIMVFPYESTEGIELSYIKEMASSINIESLPLIEIAVDLGLSVTARPGIGYYGYYSPSAKSIVLCSDDEQVFLHELSHAIDDKLGNFDRSDPDGAEIVAELSACFLAHLFGKKADMGFTKRYLTVYTKCSKDKAQFSRVLFKILDRVEAIYHYTQSKKGERMATTLQNASR